jgi:hypothetical protein
MTYMASIVVSRAVGVGEGAGVGTSVGFGAVVASGAVVATAATLVAAGVSAFGEELQAEVKSEMTTISTKRC